MGVVWCCLGLGREGRRGVIGQERGLEEEGELEEGDQRGGTNQMVQNLVPDHLHHLKGLQRRDAVDQHIPVDADKVL